MGTVPVYFDADIHLIDVFRAAQAIGCEVRGDKANGRLVITRKPNPTAFGVSTDVPNLPAFLKPQAS